MSLIRTVLGDIPAEQFGVGYAHEHIIIDPSCTTQQNPDYLLDSTDIAISRLSDFHRGGPPGLDFLLVTFRHALKLRGAADALFQKKSVTKLAEPFSFPANSSK